MRAGVVLLALVVPGVLVTITLRSRLVVADRDVDWLAGVMGPPADEADVYRRYLRRHRSHRVVGGVLGGTIAAVVGVRWYGTVRAGIGDVSPLADVLFGAVAGIVVGALVAESFRLDRRRARAAAMSAGGAGGSLSTVSTASLAVRPRPAPAPEVVGARVLTLGALLLGGVVLVVADDGGALVAAVLGGLVVAGAERTRTTVVGRGRPVLSPRADRVDRRIREVALVLVGRLEVAAAVLTVGWTVSVLPADGAAVQGLQVVLVLTALVLTIRWLHRAAPRAPRGWSSQDVPVGSP